MPLLLKGLSLRFMMSVASNGGLTYKRTRFIISYTPKGYNCPLVRKRNIIPILRYDLLCQECGEKFSVYCSVSAKRKADVLRYQSPRSASGLVQSISVLVKVAAPSAVGSTQPSGFGMLKKPCRQ